MIIARSGPIGPELVDDRNLLAGTIRAQPPLCAVARHGAAPARHRLLGIDISLV